jgi:hypothetical protein
MECTAQDILLYLERIDTPRQYNRGWGPYVRRRLGQVTRTVESLRAFAALREGFVADNANATADEFERRVVALAERFDTGEV